MATFGTETARSAITTACRGLGISSDVGRHLSSLIPIVRGKVRDLKTCYYGNDELEPVHEFVNICKQYKDLKLIETAMEIEGLVNKCSIHAAGVIITNSSFTDHNAIMVAPNGALITAWNLGESEYTGGLKYDFLNTTTMSMIQVCVESLLEAGHLEWKGSLKETYEHYFRPDRLDITSNELWNKLNNEHILKLFQFETVQGQKALNTLKPRSLNELAAANSLMRLATEEGEQPSARYQRMKNDISQWYKEMREDYQLTEDEISILEDHLLVEYGTTSVQEHIMLLSMDKRISGFDVVASNALRKSVAKGKGDMFEQIKQLFYKKGLANGCRQVFLDYIWSQVELQKNYAFSQLHTYGYSLIAITILNLVLYYNPIYWACAVLQVESASLEQETLEDDEEQDNKEKTTNYGALATAISMLQQSGIVIEPPHINTAQIGFTPDEESNSILYGLKGVSKINNETAKQIIAHRPYASFNDFVERLVHTKQIANGQLISLIKAGAFDELEAGMSREDLIDQYLRTQFKPRTTINDKLIQEMMSLGMIDSPFEQELKHYYFRAYLKSLPSQPDESTKSIKWHTVKTGQAEQDDYTMAYFDTHFSHELTEDRDYRYDEEGYLQVALGTKRKGSFEDVYSRFTQPLMAWLKSDEGLARYNAFQFECFKEKYAKGTKERWEMEALSIYLDKHEVEELLAEDYGFVSFNTLPEEAEIVGYNHYKGRQIPKFKLSRIVGCVVDKDKNKHIVSLLTPDGCVSVKFHAGSFAHYDKVISMVDPYTGTKTKVEESWFKKGTLLALTGYRYGDNFKPKTYADSIIKQSVQRLTFNKQRQPHLQMERQAI